MSSFNRFTLLALIFTGLNALFGIIGIIVSIYFSDDLLYLPMQLLIFGAIFDYLDGRIAKKSPTSSTLGTYSDSVGDVITFAILPGVMLLNAPIAGNEVNDLSSIMALGIAGFYSLCGWLRLIRFATNPTEIHFDGLPSPAAALLIGSSAILATFDEMTWLFWPNGVPLTLLTIITGLLMVITLSYPTPKRRKTPDMIAIGIAGLVVLFFVFFPHYFTLSIILLIAILYTVFGPLYLRRTSK